METPRAGRGGLSRVLQDLCPDARGEGVALDAGERRLPLPDGLQAAPQGLDEAAEVGLEGRGRAAPRRDRRAEGRERRARRLEVHPQQREQPPERERLL